MFYQKLPLYNPQFEQGKPYKKIAGNRGDSTNYGKFLRSGSGSEDGLRFPGNVLAFPTVQRTIHPTQKPVELCEYFIKTYTRPGEVVADICAGSGTTAVAALNTGRRFIFFNRPGLLPPPPLRGHPSGGGGGGGGGPSVLSAALPSFIPLPRRPAAAKNHYPHRPVSLSLSALWAVPVADLAAFVGPLFLARFPEAPGG